MEPSGDRVLSTNESTGQTDYKPVLNTFVNQTESLVHVTIGSETVTATSEHPFRICDDNGTHRWVAASELEPGMEVVTRSGARTVKKVAVVEETAKTYNFEVEGWHTYHVGEQALLVHNSSTVPPIQPNEYPESTFLEFEVDTTDSLAAQAAANSVSAQQVKAQSARPEVLVVIGGTTLMLWRTGLLRGVLQGGRSALTKPVLGIGRMGPGGPSNPLYVQRARAAGYSFYPAAANPALWNFGQNIGFVYGHALLRGAGSVRYVTPGLPLVGSFTQLEFQATYTAYLTRTGLSTLGATEAFINLPVFDNIITDVEFFDTNPAPHVDITFPDGGGDAVIRGPITYGGDFGFGFP